MRIPRLYCPDPVTAHALITLGPDAARHVARVLRLRAGAAVTLFDGRGGEYPGEVVNISKSTVTVQVGERLNRSAESPLDITLVQGISRGERMDFTLQKATELGVRRIVPVTMQRTVVRLPKERADKRLAHWRAITVQACEQCGRNELPQVDSIIGFDAWLERHTATDLDVMLSPGSAPLRATGTPRSVSLCIGPEGGFAPEESARLLQGSFVALSLGPRVLRTETAALAAVAVIQSRWGDFKGPAD